MVSSLIWNHHIDQKNNLFNGTINNKSNTLTRFPNSKNTLGFDVLQLDISNENNAVINNDTEQLHLKFKTRKDRFFLYFTTFETEIDTSYISETDDELVQPIKINEEVVIETKSSEEVKPIYQEDNYQKRILIKRLNNIDIDKGYYLITNVFSKPHLARKWKQFLFNKGYSAKTFINQKNN